MKIYISGPITGRDIDEVREHFAKAQLRIEELGHEAVNPFDNGLDETHSWKQHMIRNIALLLMQCDAICLLDGWRESRGARIEHNIATELNLAIMDEGAIWR